MIKLRCLKGKRKGMFKEGGIYSVEDFKYGDTLLSGRITILNSRAKKIKSGWRLTGSKDISAVGCIFRLRLVDNCGD